MPRKAPSLCRSPGCGQLTRVGYCPDHLHEREQRRRDVMRKSHQRYNAKRDESDKFYGTEAWRKLRNVFIRRHPLCCECESNGRVVVAEIVDHIIPRKRAPELSLKWQNLRSLCRACHNRIGERGGG